MGLLIGNRKAYAKANPRRPDGIPITAEELEAARIYEQACAAFATNTDRVGDAVRHALRTSDVDGSLLRLPWEDFQASLATMANPMAAAARAAGAKMPTTGMGAWRFDVTDPRMYEFARTQAANLVTYITDEQRQVLRDTITTAIREQKPVRDLARDIESQIGLLPRHSRTVQSAYDQTLSDAISAGKTQAEAVREAFDATRRVSRRLREARALTIARTEASRAANAARYIGWAQAVESGQVSKLSRKKWRTIPSGSMHGGPCDICAPMNKVVVLWDQPFPNGVDMPPAHPNCRCSATMLPPDTPLTNAGQTVDVPVMAPIDVQPIPVAAPTRTRLDLIDFDLPSLPVPDTVEVDTDNSTFAPEARTDVAVVLGAMLRDWPEVVEDLDYVGPSKKAFEILGEPGRRAPAGAIAWTTNTKYSSNAGRPGGKGVIGFSSTFWRKANPEDMAWVDEYMAANDADRAALERTPDYRRITSVKNYAALRLMVVANNRDGFLGSNTPRSMIVHEFGHRVFDSVLAKMGPPAVSTASKIAFLRLVLARAKESGWTAPIPTGRRLGTVVDDLAATISRYAATNPHELFAEAFAAALTNPNADPLCRFFLEVADDILTGKIDPSNLVRVTTS